MSKPSWRRALVGALASCVALAGCGGTQSALDPAGPGAAHIADVWWLMFAVCSAVFAVVMAMLVWALGRRRPSAADATPRT